MPLSKLIAGVLLNVGIFAACLFLPAGTLDWWRAWVFLAVDFVLTAVSTVVLLRAGGGVLEERFKPPIQEGQPLPDKIVVSVLLAGFAAVILFIPVDVFRLHLLPQPPSGISALGMVLLVAGWVVMTLAMRENAFAAPVVRHQEERHHHVIDTGLYSVVRHPMYAGAVGLLIGMPLWLDSYAAALLAAWPILTMMVRIRIEEAFLTQELPGYHAYATRVRHRLIPFIW
jgi:protein-S-isoprenylcysteine O-methyltransferase Ste14